MKRINILQHEEYETPGCITDWIKRKSYKHQITKLYAGETLPVIKDIDWLIVMGGPMSVHDTEMFPWLIEEKKFIKEAISSGRIVVGICLGAQLVAEALGGRVYRNDFKEIGWFPIKRIDGRTDSKLMKMFDNTETVFHWHGDTFEIPDSASREFLSEACSNQCFTYKEKVLALQFHVEITDSLLNNIISNGEEELLPGKFIQSADQLLNGAVHIKRNNELMFSILDELDKL